MYLYGVLRTLAALCISLRLCRHLTCRSSTVSFHPLCPFASIVAPLTRTEKAIKAQQPRFLASLSYYGVHTLRKSLDAIRYPFPRGRNSVISRGQPADLGLAICRNHPPMDEISTRIMRQGYSTFGRKKKGRKRGAGVDHQMTVTRQAMATQRGGPDVAGPISIQRDAFSRSPPSIDLLLLKST